MKERKLILIRKWRANLSWRREHAKNMRAHAQFFKDAWWDEV